jgi:Xaa-Pro dipeptidase
MTGDVKPITVEERQARIEKARKLMVENKIDAMYIEAGTALLYFTGVRWSGSERMFAAIIPAKGEVAYVCPHFELDRALEQVVIGKDIRVWEEDESPAEKVAQVFKDRGISTGTVAMEERVRFFLFDTIRKAAPHLKFVSADPVTIACRVIKSPAEIALMQKASDITIEAYRAVIPLFKEGMTKGEFAELGAAAHLALGAEGNIGCNFGEYTALPHGSVKPRTLRQGDVILMDGGCSVDGYRSDISRTIVFGTATQRQKDIWDLMTRTQAAAFEAAKLGVPCEEVDAASRKVIEAFGFGPMYKVPGCPHRTGHGIGLDGHEWINLVRGNKTPIAVGMCFTNEPMIVVPGEFGIRIEDDMHMTDQGMKWFSTPSPSITEPVVGLKI